MHISIWSYTFPCFIDMIWDSQQMLSLMNRADLMRIMRKKYDRQPHEERKY